MDKLKVYIAWLVKYHFWVLSGTTVLLGFIGWLLSANALADYYKSRKAKIEVEFAKTATVVNTPNHPNPSFVDGVDKLLDQKGAGLKARVLDAWNLCYVEQKKKVLIWPPALGDDCLQVIAAVGDGEIPVDYRERYFNYVRNEFPKLLEIVDAQNHTQKANDRAGQAAADRPANQKSYKVIWKADDQRLLDESLDWPRAPSSKEMRYVQENLWVYDSLLRIIAKVNENATAHYNAKIKEIISLQIARPAAQEFQFGMSDGKLIPPQPIGAPVSGPGGAAPAAPGAAGDRGASRDRAARPAGAGAALWSESVQDEGRYVDDKGQPLTGAAAAPPEFKRMPVFLQLYMDQREISRLLVECANSLLPVEVKQLRVNPGSLRRPGRTDVTSVFAGSNKGAAGAPRVVGEGGNAADRELNPYDVPVEIQGIIYIFNPPNRAKLAVAGQAAGAATEPDVAPVGAAPVGAVDAPAGASAAPPPAAPPASATQPTAGASNGEPPIGASPAGASPAGAAGAAVNPAEPPAAPAPGQPPASP